MNAPVVPVWSGHRPDAVRSLTVPHSASGSSRTTDRSFLRTNCYSWEIIWSKDMITLSGKSANIENELLHAASG